MRFDVVTLFPAMFDGYLSESIVAKGIQRGLIQVERHQLRDWSSDKHRRVDDRPFGGGAGMLLQPGPVVECVEAVEALDQTASHRVLLTPQGRRLDQAMVERLAKRTRILLICGRYEGFDQRIIDILQPEEISIGDYVVNGGEVAAMVVIDSVIRLIPEVLGDAESHQEDSFSGESRRLEYPHYTRPREFRGLTVPEVLINGDHAAIRQWREEQSQLRTAQQKAKELT
jgi:tRNA (guanine37-N1)-methyltransferase